MSPTRRGFTSGADVAQAYWERLVEPVIRERWARMPLSAARLGGGS